VDRFGQRKPEVRTVVLYGANNDVDQVVRTVLIEKARAIRQRLGISVPVPGETEQAVQAVVDTVLLRGGRATQPRMTFSGDAIQMSLALEVPEVSRLHEEMDAAAERESRQRAFFAQHGISPEEVAKEIDSIDPVLGEPVAVRRFLSSAAQRFSGELRQSKQLGVFELLPGALESALRQRTDLRFPQPIAFESSKDHDQLVVGRTHPLVIAYCDSVLGAAFAPDPNPLFSRAGAIFTDSVSLRTVLLVLRLRYLIKDETDQFAEEVRLTAFHRQNGQLTWLEPWDTAARDLIEKAKPIANMPQAERADHVRWALDFLQSQPDWASALTANRVTQLEESHNRLRKLAKARPIQIRPHIPPDILGCYVLVPARQ